MNTSTSWLDLFDLKFEKYLTPWIVRLTWTVALVLATLWFGVVMFSVVGMLMPPGEASDTSGAPMDTGLGNSELPDTAINMLMPSAEVSDTSSVPVDTTLGNSGLSDTAIPEFVPSAEQSSSRPRVRTEFRAPDLNDKPVLAVVVALTTMVGIIVCLLWIRVLLETVIVIFNIATTLKDMEGKLPSP